MTQTQEMARTHDVIDPAILYFGTPVVLLTTVSTGGAVNLMPMSSAFWLGHTGVLGMGTRSQTFRNLADTGECVLNLPSDALVAQVNSLALTTGRDPVPARKAAAGYRYEPDKFGRAGLTPVPADTVQPPRVAECPVNLEARVTRIHELGKDEVPGPAAVEVAISRVHVHPDIRLAGTENRIDPDAWRPLIMSFQHYYGLGGRLHPSRLASIDEEWYRLYVNAFGTAEQGDALAWHRFPSSSSGRASGVPGTPGGPSATPTAQPSSPWPSPP